MLRRANTPAMNAGMLQKQHRLGVQVSGLIHKALYSHELGRQILSAPAAGGGIFFAPC
jgi:hypothetical protein